MLDVQLIYCIQTSPLVYCRLRREGSGFLSPATLRHGGDYPEPSVEEKANLGKYFLIVLCLSPLTFICCYTQPTTNTLVSKYTQHNLLLIHWSVLTGPMLGCAQGRIYVANEYPTFARTMSIVYKIFRFCVKFSCIEDKFV